METIINSFLLVAAGEMGDKTQLLALLLVAKYRRPWIILAGVLVATLLNHAFAAMVGSWISSFLSPEVLRWSLAFIFFAFALWILVPDKEEEVKESGKFGVFLSTVVAFFLAEMGDKTQLATVALGAHYSNFYLVTVGTTAGMMASNVLAIFLGQKILKRIPMKWVRVVASVLFLLFGIALIIRI